jgi:hypothetical protein
MSIRERLAAFVGGTILREQQERMAQTLLTLANAYEVGRYELPPDELLRQLSEYTSSADLDYIVSLMGWEGNNIYTADMTREREYAIRRSAHAWRHSPLYQWSIWAWTNWGLGESVQVTPDDEGAAEAWDEFWSSDRNAAILGQDRIHAFSEWLLVKGDRYLVHFASMVDGNDTLRSIEPEQFPDPPITDPNDGSVPLFYKRQWVSQGKQLTLYYPDWAAFFNYPDKLEQEGLLPIGAQRSDKPSGEAGTVAVIQHVAHNRKSEGDLRGWPLGTVSLPYDDAHRRFMEDRLTVAAAKAMYVRRKQVNAGSRGLASIKSTLESSLATIATWSDTNPPAPSGSVELDNKQVTTTDLPMTTGASDAETDNKVFAWQALLGNGLFTTTAGLDTARYATALTMDKNQSMLWSRYRSFLAAQFRDMVTIVLSFKEKYGGMSFPDKSAAVSIDTLNLVDFPAVVSALSELFNTALTPLVDSGIMPANTAKAITARAWLVALQALGLEDAGELTSFDAFGVVEPGAAPAQVESKLMEQQAQAIARRDVALELALEAIREAAARVGNVQL